MIEAPKVKRGWERSSGPIASHLSYTPYFCVPRIVLQGMPIWWQKMFCWLAEMLPETPTYTCQRKDERGRFIKGDPFANYRHGDVEEIIAEYEEEKRKKNERKYPRLAMGGFFKKQNRAISSE